jgi:hypothetical protein
MTASFGPSSSSSSNGGGGGGAMSMFAPSAAFGNGNGHHVASLSSNTGLAPLAFDAKASHFLGSTPEPTMSKAARRRLREKERLRTTGDD